MIPAGRPSAAVGVALVGLVALLGGCAASPPGAPVELRVAAAASLRTAVDALVEAYAEARPGTTFVVATDSSAALRTQIEEGAPIDVFLSADAANPRALVDAGLAAAPPTPFAGNTLAIVTPADNPAAISSPADLADTGVRIVAAGEDVPISGYAAEVVRALAALDGYPAEFVAAVEANTVSREDNVAAVLAKIELGEGDAAFVYSTDATGSDVATVPIPDGANVRTTYEGVVVASSRHPADAAAFLAWVAGPDGRAVLRPLGFLAPLGA